MHKVILPRWVFSFAKKGEPEPLPEDLSALEDAVLADYEERLSAEFDELYNVDGQPSAEALARMEQIAGDIERVRAEKANRDEAAEANRRQADEIAARIRPSDPAEPAPAAAPEEPVAPAAQAASEEEPVAAIEEPVALGTDATQVLANAIVEAVTAAAAGPQRIPAEDSIRRSRRINVPLDEIRRRAPVVDVESSSQPELTITAAGDIPGFSAGQSFENGIVDLGHAMHRKALNINSPSGYVPIATINRSFEHMLDENATPDQVWDVVKDITNVDSLLAAGGWCAPSEIRYELFNIACDDGEFDLPTTGITRGGMRWPVSPTLADALGQVWHWTEANDIAAVTGGATKTCVRVPCVTFDEARLSCDGLCVTAGNLTERGYPEVIQNFIKYIMSAHFHSMNKRFVDEVVALLDATSITEGGTSATANILAAVELQAIDYRTKFGMCTDDILEVVFPDWIEGVIRADIARRRGLTATEAFAVTDAEMGAWFDRRSVRTQFIGDYQVRGTNEFGRTSATMATWPQTVDFMLYAAGTFVKGSGPVIDLGVVRDSVLNATNDHTAAWTEECNLIAQVGHEGRHVTVAICANGEVGGDATSVCPGT